MYWNIACTSMYLTKTGMYQFVLMYTTLWVFHHSTYKYVQVRIRTYKYVQVRIRTYTDWFELSVPVQNPDEPPPPAMTLPARAWIWISLEPSFAVKQLEDFDVTCCQRLVEWVPPHLPRQPLRCKPLPGCLPLQSLRPLLVTSPDHSGCSSQNPINLSLTRVQTQNHKDPMFPS